MRSVAFIVVLLTPIPAGAHRLDEFLQATRVAIERDRVNVDIDLTAGVSIAERVTAWIDSDGDGDISSSESRAYAREVLGSLALSVDGTRTPLELIETQAPRLGDIALGVGTLRVRATARIPANATGQHQMTVVNDHHPDSSIYLANALVPSDTGIHILGQRRSQDQRRLTIDYDVGTFAERRRISWLAVAVTLLAATLGARRRLGRSAAVQPHPV